MKRRKDTCSENNTGRDNDGDMVTHITRMLPSMWRAHVQVLVYAGNVHRQRYTHAQMHTHTNICI